MTCPRIFKLCSSLRLQFVLSFDIAYLKFAIPMRCAQFTLKYCDGTELIVTAQAASQVEAVPVTYSGHFGKMPMRPSKATLAFLTWFLAESAKKRQAVIEVKVDGDFEDSN